jgi:hypothetical protein
MGIDLADI